MEVSIHLKTLLNTYLVLVLLTVCSLLLAESGCLSVSLPSYVVEAVILLIVGMKVFLLALNFMELRFSPKWLLGLMGCWTAAIVTVLSGFIILYSLVS